MVQPSNPSSHTGIQLIAGLGNPGPEYANTRHNAGFWFIERLCEQYHGTLSLESKLKGLVAKVTIAGQPCVLFQPMTFMNLSGQAIQQVMRFYKIPVKHCLVAHDDLDLPPGVARLKFDGGHGGHNGLRDMFAQLGPAFYRLRLGIGHPKVREEVSDYVLHRPSKSDQALILQAIEEALQVLPDVMQGNIEKAMHTLHTTKAG